MINQNKMTAKEKAEELVRKYYTFGLNNTAQSFSWYECKQCALIAVDEIIRAIPDASDDDSPYNHELKFWQEVKHELNKSEIVTEYRDGTIQVETFKSE